MLCIQNKIGEISNIFALGGRGGDAHIVLTCCAELAMPWALSRAPPLTALEECVEA